MKSCSITSSITSLSLYQLILTIDLDGRYHLSAFRRLKKDSGCELQDLIEEDRSAKSPKHNGCKVTFTLFFSK